MKNIKNFDLEVLSEQLETLQHTYFCYDRDCTVCDGLNYNLEQMYGERRVEFDVKDIDRGRFKKIQIGGIYGVVVNGNFPILVLVLSDEGFFCRACRVTFFPQFAAKYDIIYKEWLIQPWNSFPVLKCRLDGNPVCVVDDDLIKKVKNFVEYDNSDDELILQFYQKIELDYQNVSFLDDDEELLMKYIELYNKEV